MNANAAQYRLGVDVGGTHTDLVLLDPAEPDGYVRSWAPPGFPPMRHIGYAVQWFALALTLLAIYVVTNIGKGRSALTGPAILPMDLTMPAWARRFSMK